MPNLDDFHAFISTGGDSDDSGGFGGSGLPPGSGGFFKGIVIITLIALVCALISRCA